MTLPVVAIRPEPGCSATVAAGSGLGLTIEAHPLFEIRPVAWQPVNPAGFDALLIGSANAIRHAGPALAKWRGKPVYAVGEATARAAGAAGLAVAATGSGGLQAVLDDLVPRPSRVLRLAGADHVRLEVPNEIGLETRIVYESAPLPMSEALAGRLREGAIVLLHSATAAGHFAAQCDARGIQREAITIAALGPRISASAGAGWRSVHDCAQPKEAEILALARELCHEN